MTTKQHLDLADDEARSHIGLRALRFRNVETGDYPAICRWVNERGELGLIGSEQEPTLRPGILGTWVEDATCALVFELKGVPIAFGAGSTREWELPQGTVEVCHFVLEPSQRRRYHGSTFLRIVTRLLIHGYGFRSVVARVVPDNAPALAVMQYLRWPEITNKRSWSQSASFRWFVAPEGNLP